MGRLRSELKWLRSVLPSLAALALAILLVVLAVMERERFACQPGQPDGVSIAGVVKLYGC